VYGFGTAIVVPSVSPSGSWLSPELYVSAAWVTLVTANVLIFSRPRRSLGASNSEKIESRRDDHGREPPLIDLSCSGS